MALRLAIEDRTYEDVAVRFLEHFALIARAMNEQGLWDDRDGFYYDALREADGSRVDLCARSLVGLVPLCAVTVVGPEVCERLPLFRQRMDTFLERNPDLTDVVRSAAAGSAGGRLLSVVDPVRLRRLLAKMLDEAEFLSQHGIRSLSRYHADHPLEVEVAGQRFVLDYEPAESTTALFGGNSNWRGPVWFPINYVLIEGLRRFGDFLGDAFTVECPTGSGQQLELGEVADELSRRLLSLFLAGPDGARPALGRSPWPEQLVFNEYFHGDTGEGLGASHQTGWTGLVAELALRLQPALQRTR
jgi:hypothetical protein